MLFILFDGVDDILRIKKNQLDILSSLIRSVDMINQITDPDLNKIKRDGAIRLSWVDNTDDLKQICFVAWKP